MSDREKEIADADLISLCIKGESQAWQLLFTRYNATIDHQILRTFNLDNYPYSEEDFEEVKNRVIDRLLSSENLRAINKRSSFKSWLLRVVMNKTHDYVRQRKSIKLSPDEEAKKSSLSLQQPGGGLSGRLLDDCVSAENPHANVANGDIAWKIREGICSMEWKYQIVMKLYLVFHEDLLEPDDFAEIAKKRGISLEQVQSQVSRMMDSLVEKNEKNICHEAEMRVLSAYITRLQGRLSFLRQYSGEGDDEILKTEDIIAKKQHRLSSLAEKKPKPVVPSIRDIGSILGVEEDTIATQLFRAKNILKKLVFS